LVRRVGGSSDAREESYYILAANVRASSRWRRGNATSGTMLRAIHFLVSTFCSERIKVSAKFPSSARLDTGGDKEIKSCRENRRRRKKNGKNN